MTITTELQNARITDGIAYVDVGQTKPHMVYLDGRVFQTSDLSKLQALSAYLDVVFPSTFPQVWALLERGVRVYYLRDTWLLETLRQQNHIPKNDENDARILSIVPATAWKELVKESMILRSLLHDYYVVANDIKRNKQWLSLIVDENARTLVRERINFLRKQRYALEQRILGLAEATLPYNHVSSRLGVRGVSLVTLLTYVDFSRTFRQLVMFAGFCDPETRNGRFSRRARRALTALATTAIRDKHQRYGQVYSIYMQKLASRKKALLRVQKRLFKDVWQAAQVGRNQVSEDGGVLRTQGKA